jgi:hypothetical protein
MDKKYDDAEFLNDIPLGTPEQERQLARNWINTAAEFCRNMEYYREERNKYIRKYEPEDSVERKLLPENGDV